MIMRSLKLSTSGDDDRAQDCDDGRDGTGRAERLMLDEMTIRRSDRLASDGISAEEIKVCEVLVVG